jgi:hypothetical protein
MPHLFLPDTIAFLERSIQRKVSNRIHGIDERFFQTIDTEAKAYWLGMMMADGSVTCSNGRSYRVSIALAEEDGDHLKALRDQIAPMKDLSREKPHGRSVQHSIRFAAHSNAMALDLIRLNCVPRKSLILEWPSKLPDSLAPHFVRGFFDGDGGFIRNGGRFGIKIVSSHRFCARLSDVLAQAGIASKVYLINAGRNSGVHVRDMKSIAAFARYIYKDATIRLDRKWELFKGWAEEIKVAAETVPAFRPTFRLRNGKVAAYCSIGGMSTYLASGLTKEEAAAKGQPRWAARPKVISQLQRAKLEIYTSLANDLHFAPIKTT